MLGLLGLVLLGCSGERPLPPAVGPSGAVALSRVTDVTGLELPESSRAEALPPRVKLLGRFQEHRRGEGWVEHKIPMPFREVYLGHSASRQPKGLSLAGRFATPLKYGTAARPWMWRVDKHGLYIKLPPGVQVAKDTVTMRYEPAYRVEKLRHRASAGLSDTDFVFRTEELDAEALRGVYLPAPARATWSVKVPSHARFHSKVQLLRPEVRTRTKSDGATARVEARDGSGGVVAEAECRLKPGEACDLELDLVPFDDQALTLALSSAPGADAELDYVFFEDPVVATRKADPKQVVLVFVDTLRADRLSAYGYERESPNIDRFASSGFVFEQARSVSPWTLPAARAVLTGRQPEEWDDATTLAGHLSKRGWATTAFVTNAYLSRPFGMGRDWTTYRYLFLNRADRQVEAAKRVLAEYPDRDHLLLVHFMDTHLPYREPEAFRNVYEGERPAGVPERFGLLEMHRFADDPAARQYLSDRYDQTVRYVDSALGDLFEALDDDAVVLLYSDHGEEFWEHGGVEHGHALWDEVLRVPMILKAPGLAPGRTEVPVSVMDIAPTVYELVGVEPPADLDGRSVVGLARGTPEAVSAFSARPQVFGRTLRDRDAWGLLQDGRKIVSRDGRVQAIDLSAPGEDALTAVPAEELDAIRRTMSDTLGREFVPVLRIRGPGSDKVWRAKQGEVHVTLDGPVRASWLGTNAPKLQIQQEGARVSLRNKNWLPNEIYILPESGVADVKRVEVKVVDGGETYTAVWPDDAVEGAWLEVGPPGAKAKLGVELTPLPAEVEVPTTSEEMSDELKILGYLEE